MSDPWGIVRLPHMQTTDIVVILDRSGSMAAIAEDVVGGLNTFITTQQRDAAGARFSLVQFDDEYEVVHFNVPMGDVPTLGPDDFTPRGSTALLDAIGRTIVDLDRRLAAQDAAERPERVIVVVQTDGQENSSREFTRDQVFALVSQREQQLGANATGPVWEFVFLAANQDAIAAGGEMGFQAAKSVDFDASAAGVQAMQQVVADKVLMSRLACSDMSYSASDRQRSRPGS
jgi:uncharacterized protein YegL